MNVANINNKENTVISILEFLKPYKKGKEKIPADLSPSISSISLTISRIKFIKNANTAGIIAYFKLYTETPP